MIANFSSTNAFLSGPVDKEALFTVYAMISFFANLMICWCQISWVSYESYDGLGWGIDDTGMETGWSRAVIDGAESNTWDYKLDHLTFRCDKLVSNSTSLRMSPTHLRQSSLY